MKLRIDDLNNKEWKEKGYILPHYDVKKVREKTKEKPEWVHFGAGNIFRAFMSAVTDEMLNEGLTDTGIIVAEGFDEEIIDAVYRKYDNLNIYIELKADGDVTKRVNASVVQSLKMDGEDFFELKEIFECESLKMASFTITEKGYSTLNNIDINEKNDPYNVKSYLGKICALLYYRYLRKYRITLVSMDNCSRNGDRLKDALLQIANMWVELGYAEKSFITYLNKSVSYPLTMIDKITPRPDANVEKMLKEDGVEDINTVITDKNSYVSAFVNAEESQYLAIEDRFLNGRLKLEGKGIYYTNRDTVEKVERMKVCTCLNPLHTALAILGCLLNYKKISDEMKDEDLVRLIKHIGYDEGLRFVCDPKIINPKDFIDECINIRFPNPYLPDSPKRIATDTSQKLAIRFGETLKEYVKLNEVSKLKYIPLVYAGYLRYLEGIDDSGNVFERSTDPKLEILDEKMKNIAFGKDAELTDIESVLRDEDIFGLDLIEAGLGELVLHYFNHMNKINGVRKLLREI
ncbi:MAG: mannitol dehydrogenase family protein [Erysipelotrichaceae bacterium]